MIGVINNKIENNRYLDITIQVKLRDWLIIRLKIIISKVDIFHYYLLIYIVGFSIISLI